MTKKSWIIFIVIILGVFALLIFAPKDTADLDTSKIDATAVQSANSQNGKIADHVEGKIGSPVTLIEYGDYSCSACYGISSVVDAITKEYQDQLQYVFRNYPLTKSHPNSMAASAAAEAAGLQGKYWEIHSQLFEQQSSWEELSVSDRTDYFKKLASSLGLDIDKFTTDMASSAVSKKITYDQALGNKQLLDATPTFYLNGTKIDVEAASTSDGLKKVINAALTKAGIALPAGESK